MMMGGRIILHHHHHLLVWWLLLLLLLRQPSWPRVVVCASGGGIGANWGDQASHPLSPSVVAQLLKDNGIQKVKLFDAQDGALNALANTGIQVMVGIPNELLDNLASSIEAAQEWVSNNISSYVTNGVDIRYVAVGNEPLLNTYNGTFLQATSPALENIQGAIIKSGLGSKVKVTVPLNADVYQTSSGKPSDGDFRTDIHDLMLTIVKFLSDNDAPFTVNIYPFISLYNDPNFPVDYAFFEGSLSTPVVDGSTTYQNTFDANHDTLVWALSKNGFANLPIIIGEIGWPTDGDMNANLQYAQRFNQGLMKRIISGQGTPMRPGPIDAYLFSLIDEDEKSIQPGNFERHWGIFYYDGSPKYQLNLLLGATNSSGGGLLVRAKNVQYLDNKWCVFKPSVSLDDQNVAPSVSYACANADCTSLGYRTSCGDLDARGNISYAFNSYYQKNDQDGVACKFSGLGTITNKDPSTGTCRFEIMIEAASGFSWNLWRLKEHGISLLLSMFIIPLLLTLS